MSIWTRDKVWFSTDKRTYWEHRPGNNDARLVLNDTAVITISTTGATIADLNISDDMAITGDLAVTGGLAVTGAVTVSSAGSLGVAGSLSFALATGVATASTIPNSPIVSLLTATAAAPTYVLAAPSSAGIIKILINTETDSTHHIDFPSGDLVNLGSTESYINMGPAYACVGLISLSSDQWAILFPSFSTATVVVSTVAS